MKVIPCSQNAELKRKVEEFAEVLKTESHKLGNHGLSEDDFYRSGLFQGAIERIRGQFSATMRDKREFVQLVLNHMQDLDYIRDWESSGDSNRHDYNVTLCDGRIAVIELKGCLDGNNTNIFERPAHANEFVIWSVCSNASGSPQHNVWSGIHTRLSAEIIQNEKLVDGLIVWDWLCGTALRPCPKVEASQERLTTVAQFRLPPPCIYLFPSTIPSVRNNPNPNPHSINGVGFLKALHACFKGHDDELHNVRFSVAHKGSETVRSTCIERAGVVLRSSKETPIRRK